MACPIITILPSSIANGQVGVPYSQSLTQIDVLNANWGVVAGIMNISGISGGSFVSGNTVTGMTSGATAVILTQGNVVIGTVYVKNISGTFIAGETVSVSSPVPATATLNSITLTNPLPTGLSISNASAMNGLISGTPRRAGIRNVYIFAENLDAPSCDAGVIQYSNFTIAEAERSGGSLWAIMPEVVYCSQEKYIKMECPDAMLVNGVRYFFSHFEEDNSCCFKKEMPFGYLYGME